MPKRKRAAGKRSGTSKPRKRARKAIARIAKSVVLRTAETKKNYFGIGPGEIGKDSFITYNIVTDMAHGDTQNSFQGDEFYAVGLKVDGWLRAKFTGTDIATETHFFQIVVFGNDNYYLLTSLPESQYKDVNSTNYTHLTADSTKVKVLKDIRMTIDSKDGDGTIDVAKRVSFYVPLRKTMKFHQWQVNRSMKGLNYYVGVYANTWSNVVKSGIEFYGQGTLYYKDP